MSCLLLVPYICTLGQQAKSREGLVDDPGTKTEKGKGSSFVVLVLGTSSFLETSCATSLKLSDPSFLKETFENRSKNLQKNSTDFD